MMLLIECMGCAGCSLQKAAEGDILRSHTQIFIRQNSAERAHTKTHLQTVISFCVEAILQHNECTNNQSSSIYTV
jgi:hypothetical protein